MTIQQAKDELEKYKSLKIMEEEAMYQLKQLNADLNLIGGYNVHIDGGERDFGRVTLLDKIHSQQLKTAQYAFDMANRANLIRDKLKQLKSPYGALLLKRYLEFKSFNQISRELNYEFYWTYKLHNKALELYAKISLENERTPKNTKIIC